jgi:hypothetical protein
MRDFLKNKVVTVLIVIATVILAGVAIFTAIRLYQLRQESVAPSAPESKPAAATPQPTYEACSSLAFTITQEATPTPTPTSTATTSPTATPTLPPGATETPTPTATATLPPGATATPTPTSTLIAEGPTATPTEAPSLPEAGIPTPTILGVGVGFILLIISLALAL